MVDLVTRDAEKYSKNDHVFGGWKYPDFIKKSNSGMNPYDELTEDKRKALQEQLKEFRQEKYDLLGEALSKFEDDFNNFQKDDIKARAEYLLKKVDEIAKQENHPHSDIQALQLG